MTKQHVFFSLGFGFRAVTEAYFSPAVAAIIATIAIVGAILAILVLRKKP